MRTAAAVATCFRCLSALEDWKVGKETIDSHQLGSREFSVVKLGSYGIKV